MLVLSRKANQSFQIGEDITVKVLEIRHGRTVRLGITAPREIPVYREELLDLPHDRPADAVDREHYCDGAGDA